MAEDKTLRELIDDIDRLFKEMKVLEGSHGLARRTEMNARHCYAAGQKLFDTAQAALDTWLKKNRGRDA